MKEFCLSVYLVDVKMFHRLSENFDLLVALQENSERAVSEALNKVMKRASPGQQQTGAIEPKFGHKYGFFLCLNTIKSSLR